MGARRATGGRPRVAGRRLLLCALLAVAVLGCLPAAHDHAAHDPAAHDGARAPSVTAVTAHDGGAAPTTCAHCADPEGAAAACALALLLVLTVLIPARARPSWYPRRARRRGRTFPDVLRAPPRAPSLHVICVCRT